MASDNFTKARPVLALAGAGTALGTVSAIIDTSAYKYIQINAIHGGTGGSRTLTVMANVGSQKGTAVTTLPNPVLVGSVTSIYAGTNTLFSCGILADQAVIGYGSSSDASFSLGYILYD